MIGLDHAGYALQRLTGSENLAYFSIDCRDLVLELLRVFSGRIREHARAIMETGINAPFQWVGPEVFIPPLMGYSDFEEFVFNIDKPLCDDIHNGGSYVWVHCHGKVARLIDRFIEMGVDILNPLEPPKNGDIDLKEVVER
jgi:uroporphyrinogen-III decarboxylase